MNTINLIPPDLLAQRESKRIARRWLRRLGLHLIILAAVFGGFSLLAHGHSAEARKLTRDYTVLLDRFRGAQSLLDERARLEQRRQVIRLIREETPVTMHLRSLGESLPNNSYLLLVEFHKEPAPPGVDPGGRFVLRGRAPGHAEVGAILRSLDGTEAFESVRLVSAHEQTNEDNNRWVLFEIDLRLCEEQHDA